MIPAHFNMGRPMLSDTVWVAPGAVVVGNVAIGSHSSVWYGAVIRADLHAIMIGECTNVQDGVVMHVENDRGCTIGSYVTIGHRAIIHAATIEDDVVIGMGAILLNGAIVQRGAVVAAGAVVTENQLVPAGALVAGVPAVVKKSQVGTNPEQANRQWAEKYKWLSQQHQALSDQ